MVRGSQEKTLLKPGFFEDGDHQENVPATLKGLMFTGGFEIRVINQHKCHNSTTQVNHLPNSSVVMSQTVKKMHNAGSNPPNKISSMRSQTLIVDDYQLT